MNRIIMMFLLGGLLSTNALGQSGDWELRKNDKGIKVFTREVGGSEFAAFRGEMRVRASLASLAAVLYDVADYPEWLPLTSEARLIDRSAPHTHVHYTVSEAPWPISDRDAVVRYTYDYEAAARRLTVRLEAVPDYLPETEHVRVRQSQGAWTFTQQADGYVLVTYELHADPNGDIPAWLANQTAVDQPFGTLKALRKQVKHPVYQGRSFAFLME